MASSEGKGKGPIVQEWSGTFVSTAELLEFMTRQEEQIVRKHQEKMNKIFQGLNQEVIERRGDEEGVLDETTDARENHVATFGELGKPCLQKTDNQRPPPSSFQETEAYFLHHTCPLHINSGPPSFQETEAYFLYHTCVPAHFIRI